LYDVIVVVGVVHRQVPCRRCSEEASRFVVEHLMDPARQQQAARKIVDDAARLRLRGR